MVVFVSTDSTDSDMNISEHSDSLTEVLVVTGQVGSAIDRNSRFLRLEDHHIAFKAWHLLHLSMVTPKRASKCLFS